MKPADVKLSIYIAFNKENNKEGPEFKIGDNVRISKYKNISAKDYVPNWSEKVFATKKVKPTVPWTYVIIDLNGEEIFGIFYEREFQKTNEKEFRVKKVINKNGDKLYVKWKSWIVLLIVGLIKKTNEK